MNSSINWLQIGLWGMIFGTISIGLIGVTLRREDRSHVYLAGWITLLAATAYYAMTVGFGTFTINGQTVQLARYADWIVTTPLLLISLITLGLPSGKSPNRNSILFGAVGLDVYMILTGVFASLTADKWPWYVFSCFALVFIAYMLYGVVLSESREVAKSQISGMYLTFTLALSSLWLAYPAVWYLASSGVGAISYSTEIGLYAVLDLTAKAVFGIALLLNIKRLASTTKAKSGESTLEAVAK